MTAAAPSSDAPDHRLALWSLTFGNVVIGTGALAFVGMLDTIARDLRESPSAIGLIAGLFSLAICISGPPLGALTSRYDRRLVLTASLALFAVGHFAAAVAQGWWTLLLIRVLTAIAGTLFTPQAAATASLLVPARRRARTMAFVFLGWSIAAVVGMPAGALIASGSGWRTAMTCIGLLSTVGALLVWWRLPQRLFVGRIDRAAWQAIADHPTLLRVAGVTAIQASAQFTLYSYIVIAYRDTLLATPLMLTLLLSLNGLAGFAGNLVAGRVAERRGPPVVIHVALLSIAAAFVLWIVLFEVGPGPAGLAIAIVAAILWGAGNFGSNSMQQVRLVDLAPPLASVSVALNTSAIYLGQFIGAAVGGLVLAHPFTSPPSMALPWVALPVFFVAIGMSIAAERRIERIGASPATFSATCAHDAS
ncbi:MAG: MFS transporter [Burkholderiaceae bacterium]